MSAENIVARLEAIASREDQVFGAMSNGLEIREAAAEIVRLRGEVAMTEQQKADRDLLLTGTSFMRDGKRIDPATVRIETPAPAMPNGVEVPPGWKIEADGEALRVTRPDGVLSAWLHRPTTNGSGMYDLCMDLLRAADNRDAAGVVPVCPATGCGAQVLYECPACSHHNYPPRDTPAAVPAGEAVAVCGTCNGVGMIGGHRGQTPDSFEQWAEDCPDCTPQPADGEAVEFVAVPDDYRNQASGYRAGWTDAMNAAPVQAAPQEGEAMDRGPWRRKGARFYSDDFTHDVSLVVGGDFGSDEVEDRYLDWLLSVLNGPAGAALQHRGDSRGGEASGG